MIASIDIRSSWTVDERGLPTQIAGIPVPPTCAACHERGHDAFHCEAVPRDELPIRWTAQRKQRTDEELQAEAVRAIALAAPISREKLARIIGGDYYRATAAIDACIADGRIAWQDGPLRRLVLGANA